MRASTESAATRGTAYRWGVSELREAGVLSPALDTAILLGEAAGLCGSSVLLDRAARLEAGQMTKFRLLIERRRRREPVSRILGRREFFGLPFKVTPDVLDPRPETETLVEVSLRLLEAGPSAPTILDLGTGSGALAVTLAALLPAARVLAVDICPRALAVARSNAAANGVSDRVTFLQGDMRAVPLAPGSCDLLVSNPPYIRLDEFMSLPPEVLDQDPALALLAGPDGTEFYGPLADQAGIVLRPGGAIAVETGAGQGPEVMGILRARGLRDLRVERDLAGRDRVVAGRTDG